MPRPRARPRLSPSAPASGNSMPSALICCSVLRPEERAMSHVFHRDLRHRYPVAMRGEGVHLIDEEGRRYIDGSGGAAVSCLGHGHPDVIAAMHAQLDKLAYAHTSFFTTEVAEELAETLVAGAPAGIGRVYMVSGGSEAIEAA